MFYINLFLKGLLNRPWAATSWGISALTIVFLSLNGPNIETLLSKKITIKKDINPYFYAIMPKKINSEYVKRKLVELPGVEKVFILSQEKVSSQIKAILNQANIELDKDLMDLNYAGIKVSLSTDLKLRSQDLIRNYLARLTGKNEVTMGAIKIPEVNTVHKKSFFLKNQYLAITLAVILAYFISLGMLYRSLKDESFVFEQYQRKTQVYLKSFSYSQAPLVIAVALSCLYYKFVMLPLMIGVAFSMTFYLILGERRKVC